MNTAQSTQEKRTIKVREFLQDFRSGMNDEDLQKKYQLSQLGLEKFYSMLTERGILTQEEISRTEQGAEPAAETPPDDAAVTSPFICPRCMASHETMIDVCTNCGVSFQELIDQPDAPLPQANASERHDDAEDEPSPPPSVLDEIFGSPHTPDGLSARPPAGFDDEFCAHPRVVEKDDDLLHGDDFSKFRGGFEDSPDEVVPGMPLDYVDSPSTSFETPTISCDSCETVMQPGIRDVYDRKQANKAFMISGILFVLGLLGSISVTFFTGYSFARLLAVYGTGLFLLFGMALLTVGSFLFLAREKVYYCPTCKRVYPRG